MLIDGQAVPGASDFAVIDPATGEAFARCPKADVDQLERAVAAANRAFPIWSATSIDERAATVVRLAEALERDAASMAALLTQEQGKPLDQAMFEIMAAAGLMKGVSVMRPQTTVLRDTATAKVIEVHRPLGVVAAIVPWNFPIMLLMGKVAPALLTGNTMVVKPAPTTPLTALLFGEICREILPPGVINIICDENELGPILTSHPDVAKVAFTGSTATGAKVMASAAGTIKRVTLELGGNDAAIVLDDLDPVQAAQKIFPLAMANAGQICMAIKRVYVPEGMYDAFCATAAAMAQGVPVGPGNQQGTVIGPVQNAAQFERLKVLLDEAKQKGTVLAGGDVLDRPGYFVQPTIVRDMPDDSDLVSKEQFGPILPIQSYSDVDDAIRRVNNSQFGLGGSVWSSDVERATEVALKLNSGTVWVNQHMGSDPEIPFRGARQSGLGGEMGQDGLHEYCQAHIINIAKPA